MLGLTLTTSSAHLANKKDDFSLFHLDAPMHGPSPGPYYVELVVPGHLSLQSRIQFPTAPLPSHFSALPFHDFVTMPLSSTPGYQYNKQSNMPVAEPDSLLDEFFGTVWTIVSFFFSHTAFLVSSFFLALFHTILPMIVAGFIIYGVLFAVAGAVRATARWLGWMDPKFGPGKVKGNESDKPVPVNNSNDKRRVEIEIEFLEEMLRVKREKLKKLD